MTAASTAPRYQPYLPGPFRWRLGLRPLDLEHWFELDTPDVEAQMRHVQRMLRDHHATVVAVRGDIEPEASEVYQVVLDHLRHHHREHLERWTPQQSGEVHPLEAAARLVPEDFALLVERGGRLVFGGGVVCSPNRWDLRSKLGQSMAEVHAPVAGLNDQLQAPIDRFLDRLGPERSYWRLGWGVLDTDQLYQPLDGTAAPRPGHGDPIAVQLDDVHVRIERETLRRFSGTGAVLFTIRTHLSPLRAIIERPDQAALLAEAIEAMPADVAHYKELDAFGRRVLSWLRDDEHELRS
jgi:hypothetical protein